MLEEDNDRLSEEIAFLCSQMEEPDGLNAGVSEDRAKVAQLEKQLQNAMAQISRMEQDGDPLSDAEMELIMAKETIDSLTESLDARESAQSELQEKLKLFLKE